MTGDTLAARIEASEGRRLFVYDDATGNPLKAGMTLVGNPTIAVGRELSRTGLSDDECAYLLANDIIRVTTALDALIAWWRRLDGVRQMVVAEMAFNLGPSGLMNFTSMLAALKAGDYETAADEMLDSAWARQVGDRAKRLSAEMRGNTV